MASRITAKLFGDFQITIDQTTHTRFRTTKVQALLAYLIVNSESVIARDALGDLLWPGLPQQSAQVNLRTVLYQARKVLAGVVAKPIISASGTVRLNPELAISADLYQFTAHLTAIKNHEHTDIRSCGNCREQLEQAVELYDVRLLDNVYLPDSNVFEAWLMGQRTQYERQFFDALTLLTIIYLHNNRYADAEKLARRQLAHDNLREVAYQQLMEAQAHNGQREIALATFEQCRKLLDDELGMSPAQRTVQLAERIAAGEIDIAPVFAPDARGYELLDKLGSGAFGDVHRAYQPLIGREVAVKIIKRDYANRPNFIRRFEVEAQTIAKLEHPYIVPLYDYWRDPEGAFLVMRYMRGGNLEQALEERTVWQSADVLRLVDQIGSALTTAHEQGIVHRDLKPANILLDETGNTYLSDFGIARHIMADEASALPVAMLTSSPYYTSPEQLNGQPTTPRSDIYTFGFLIFELLAGRKPFAGVSLGKVLQQHVAGSLPSLHALRPDLSPELDGVLLKATATDPEERYADVQTFASDLHTLLADETTAVLPTLSKQIEGNPYKGLRAFQESDAGVFFGRTNLIDQLIGSADVSSAAKGGRDVRAPSRFLAVVGPSGSGKSSVVKAGLLPKLRAGAIDGSENWFITEMVPSTHPLEELEAALLRVAVEPPASLIEPLEKDERGLIRVLKRILPTMGDQDSRAPSQLLLVIDQFEELFTLAGEQQRQQFLDNLLTALDAANSQLRVVVTLRADFYDRPLQVVGLAEKIQAHNVVITPLNAVELEQAIMQPAALAGVRFADGLVTRIVDDVRDQPGILPLLQYALTELFERRENDVIPLESYAAIGGVTGVLGKQAEEIFANLSSEEQMLTKQLFLRLITLGEGVEDTRRRVLQSELEKLSQEWRVESGELHPSSDQRSAFILHPFGAARLLSFDRDPTTREPTVEVAHEALLREWPRLRGWLDESREDVRMQRLVGRGSAEWRNADQDRAYLLRGSRLELFAAWAETTSVALTADEREFLTASSAAKSERVAEEKSRQQRELQQAQALAEAERKRAEVQTQSASRLRRFAAGLVLLLVVAVGSAIFAITQQRAAEANFIVSERIRLASQAQNAIVRGEDGELSMLLALQSLQMGYSAEADTALQATMAQGFPAQTYLGHSADISDIKFSQDGRLLATASNDNTVRIWDVQSGEELQTLVGHTAPVLLAQFSPDGQYVLSSGNDETVRLWSTTSGEQQLQVQGNTIGTGIAFSPDGKRFISQGNFTLEIYDTESGNLIRQVATLDGDGLIAHFSSDGQFLMGATTRDAWVMELATGEKSVEFIGHEGWIGWGDISSDGRYALTTGQDGTARVWDVKTGEELRRFEGHSDAIFTGNFSPDDQTIVTGSYDKTVRLWDVMSGKEIRRIQGHTDFAIATFSPDGKFVATAGGDHIARLWAIEPQSEPAMLIDFSTAHFQDQTAVTVSPNNGSILVGRLTGNIQIYAAQSGQLQHDIRVGNTKINAQDMSPDGQLLVSGDSEGVVHLWDIAAGVEIWAANRLGAIHDVRFTADGRTVLVADDSGVASLLDTQSGSERQQYIGHEGAVLSIRATQDGSRLVTGGADGTARLWDAESGAEIRQFLGHTDAVHAVAIAPNQVTLVTGSADQTLRNWNIETGAAVSEFVGHTGVVLHTLVSPDGQYVLSGSEDQTARLWDSRTGEEIHQYSGHISPVMMINFSADGKHVLTAGSRAVFKRLTTLADLTTLACSQLSRGFTTQEQLVYNISEGSSPCEIATTQIVQVEPTWTPVLATPAPDPIEMQFITMELANIGMGMPVQHVFISANADTVARPVELNEEMLSQPLFNASEPISDTLQPPFDLGPFPKGEPLGFTLADWTASTGHGTYTLKGSRAELDLAFHNLVPNGVYTLWCVKFQNDPFVILEELPCGATDGSENTVDVDDTGYGTITLEMDAFPLSTFDATYEVALAYHSDGQTHGASPGEYGKNLHAAMIFDFLPPDQ